MRGIVIVDHGSRRPEANAAVEEIASHVQTLLPDCVVRFAHMELAAPTIRDAVDACVEAGVTQIVVHPYFLAPGNHSTNDIPELVREATQSHPRVDVQITAPLGPHPDLARLVALRVEEAKR